MFASATSSSSSGAREIHQPSRWASTSESSPSQSAYSAVSGEAVASSATNSADRVTVLSST